jgi:hypothetical protein
MDIYTKSRLYGIITNALRDMQNLTLEGSEQKTGRDFCISIVWKEREMMTTPDGKKWERIE